MKRYSIIPVFLVFFLFNCANNAVEPVSQLPDESELKSIALNIAETNVVNPDDPAVRRTIDPEKQLKRIKRLNRLLRRLYRFESKHPDEDAKNYIRRAARSLRKAKENNEAGNYKEAARYSFRAKRLMKESIRILRNNR